MGFAPRFTIEPQVYHRKSTPMHIRKPTTRDVKAIKDLLDYYARKGLLLPRPLSELYDHLRDYVVLEEDPPGKTIGGVCALGICWEDLAEIRSLAVEERLQGRGFGRRLVNACLDEARSLGLKQIFTLTYVPAFFAKIGFREVEKSALPHKIWSDCLKCPKFPNCDETALMTEL
jgi:amino-acid N-acetyltransferase